MTAGICRRCGCTDDDFSGCIERTGAACSWVEADLCSACSGRVLPDSMTPAIAEVLGLMNFTTGPIADSFRAAGHDIQRRIEEEQAFVLFRFLPLAILHGDDWRDHAGVDIQTQLATIKAGAGKA